MQHGALLDIAARANPDRLVVGTDDGARPYAYVIGQFGAADDGSFGGHEGAFGKGWRVFGKLIDGHVFGGMD